MSQKCYCFKCGKFFMAEDAEYTQYPHCGGEQFRVVSLRYEEFYKESKIKVSDV